VNEVRQTILGFSSHGHGSNPWSCLGTAVFINCRISIDAVP